MWFTLNLTSCVPFMTGSFSPCSFFRCYAPECRDSTMVLLWFLYPYRMSGDRGNHPIPPSLWSDSSLFILLKKILPDCLPILVLCVLQAGLFQVCPDLQIWRVRVKWYLVEWVLESNCFQWRFSILLMKQWCRKKSLPMWRKEKN